MKKFMFAAMDFWAFIFCLLVAILYTVLYGKRNRLHQYIALFSACVAGLLFSDCLAWFFRGADNMLVILKVSNFFSFFFSYLVNIPFVLYIYGAADKKPGPGAWVIFSCIFLSFVLLCVSQWNGLLYYFDADNLYHRNNRWYWLVSFFYVIENITMFIILFVHRKRIAKGRFYGILIILLFPLLTVIIQTFIYGYSLATTMATLEVLLFLVQLLYTLKVYAARQTINGDEEIRLQTFGDFQLFIGNKPVSFHYSKTKELLAILTDRRGAYCSNAMLCSLLWEDDFDSDKNAYLRKLRQDLFDTLSSYGKKDIILHRRGEMALNAEKVHCDYYDFLAKKSMDSYMGEYMRQYSWAEDTNAFLSQENTKKY